MPDASIPHEVLERDIASIAKIGAGGLEFVPFHNYGDVLSDLLPVTDWVKYGFGTPAFRDIFVTALNSSKRNDILMDFAIGASQGQGVPSEPATPGLALELVYGFQTIPGGQCFDEPLPEPITKFNELSIMGSPEQWGESTLVAVVAGGIKSGKPTQSTA